MNLFQTGHDLTSLGCRIKIHRKGGERHGSRRTARRDFEITDFPSEKHSSILMHEFHVSEKTIRRDIRALMLKYPLETFSGNGGGVQIPEWYAPNKNLLSKEEVTVLEELLQTDVYQSRILKQILARFGPDTYRPYKA